MKVTNKEICQQFSEGNFPFCYPYFDTDIVWDLVGSAVTKGKDTMIAHCDKMMQEMAASTLKNTNNSGDGEMIAIEGICTYTNADNKPGEVAYCDVFHFKNGKITRITSYCIEKKLSF